MQSLLKTIFALLVLISVQVFAATDFLSPEKAFRVEATWIENSNQVEIELMPAKGYYLYQDSLQFNAGPETGKLYKIRPLLPLGVEKFDETFQKKLQVSLFMLRSLYRVVQRQVFVIRQ